MAAVGKYGADDNTKPEFVMSSGCVQIKSEETDDEDMCNDTDRSSSHENHLLPINIKEESNVKVELKNEDDISTDDERSPDHIVSSSSGYDPVKSEETDDEELDEDNNTSNPQSINIEEAVKVEVKSEDDDISTDDEYGSQMKEPVNPPVQPNASNGKVWPFNTQQRRKGRRRKEKEKQKRVTHPSKRLLV